MKADEIEGLDPRSYAVPPTHFNSADDDVSMQVDEQPQPQKSIPTGPARMIQQQQRGAVGGGRGARGGARGFNNGNGFASGVMRSQAQGQRPGQQQQAQANGGKPNLFARLGMNDMSRGGAQAGKMGGNDLLSRMS